MLARSLGVRGLGLASIVAGVITLAGCRATVASDHAARCDAMKRDLDACLGGQAPALDCSSLSPGDVTRIQGAMDTFSCAATVQGITLDGDPESASCRMFGVGCVAPTLDAPARAPAKFPIVLVNGIDDSPLFRWSDRIVRVLREQSGQNVQLATLPAWSSVRVRAAALAARLEEIRRDTGAAKVNLVCHSLGGLDCRYLASPAGLAADRGLAPDAFAHEIASVTTVATAHRGTRAADVLLGLVPDDGRAKLVDALLALTGGALGSTQSSLDPHVQDGLSALTTSEAARFSDAIVDADGVYYQSWAGYSRPFGAASADWDARVADLCGVDAASHDYMALPLAPFTDAVGRVTNGGVAAPNDGLVTIESAKWGNFRGCIPADHMEQLGQRNLPDVNVRTGFDVAWFYASVAADLAARGF